MPTLCTDVRGSWCGRRVLQRDASLVGLARIHERTSAICIRIRIMPISQGIHLGVDIMSRI